jgi:hypothetical protein
MAQNVCSTTERMIASLHVASGAAAGAVTRSRTLAVLLGPALHLAADWVPHRDMEDRTFELASSAFGVILLAFRRGPTHPVTLGALSAAAPDLEHFFPVLQPAGSKLFHGRRGWHRSGRLSLEVQLLAAATVIGFLAVRKRGR